MYYNRNFITLEVLMSALELNRRECKLNNDYSWRYEKLIIGRINFADINFPISI
jgi:hypothetical protein